MSLSLPGGSPASTSGLTVVAHDRTLQGDGASNLLGLATAEVTKIDALHDHYREREEWSLTLAEYTGFGPGTPGPIGAARQISRSSTGAANLIYGSLPYPAVWRVGAESWRIVSVSQLQSTTRAVEIALGAPSTNREVRALAALPFTAGDTWVEVAGVSVDAVRDTTYTVRVPRGAGTADLTVSASALRALTAAAPGDDATAEGTYVELGEGDAGVTYRAARRAIGTLLLARSATASPAVAVLADDGPPTANAAAIPADWDWQIGDLVLRRRDARELYFPHDVSRGETTESIRALIWTGVPAGTLAVGAATLRALGPEIDASLILPRITDVDAGRHVAVRADLRGTEYVDPPSGGGGQGQSGVTGFHISATAPANARAGWLWSDTSSNTLKRYDGSAWIEVGASDGFHVGAAAPGTASAGEYWSDTSSNTLKRYDGSAWIVQQHGASLDSLVGARAPVALSQAQSRLDLNSPAGAAVTARTAVVALPSAASAGDRLVARWAWHARPGAPAHPLCTIGLRDVTGAADLDVIWPIWDADAGILSWDLPAGCASVQFIGRFDPVEAGGAHATIDISAVEMHSGAQAISRYVEGRARRVASLAAAQATAREADARAAQDVQILATLQTSIEGVLHLAHLVSIWRRAGPKPAAPAPAAGDYTGPGQWSVLPAGWYTSPAAVPAGAEALWQVTWLATWSGTAWTFGTGYVAAADSYRVQYSASADGTGARSAPTGADRYYRRRDDTTGAWSPWLRLIHDARSWQQVLDSRLLFSSHYPDHHGFLLAAVDWSAVAEVSVEVEMYSTAGSWMWRGYRTVRPDWSPVDFANRNNPLWVQGAALRIYADSDAVGVTRGNGVPLRTGVGGGQTDRVSFMMKFLRVASRGDAGSVSSGYHIYEIDSQASPARLAVYVR